MRCGQCRPRRTIERISVEVHDTVLLHADRFVVVGISGQIFKNGALNTGYARFIVAQRRSEVALPNVPVAHGLLRRRRFSGKKHAFQNRNEDARNNRNVCCYGKRCVSADEFISFPDENLVGDQPGLVPTPEEEQLPAEYRRQMVFFRTSEQPGTIIVNTSERFLYLIQADNRAIRYGIGVGRDGFQWHGLKYISRKAEWPDWTPPPEMIARQPYLPRFMAGGPGNPLGARALYIGGTVYRIHGTNQPGPLGRRCLRDVSGSLTRRLPISMSACR